MKFFSGMTTYEYPDKPEELRAKILYDAINRPQKIACAFFSTYFDSTSVKNPHPLLGDLSVLANEIKALWNSEERGTNLVAGFIEFKLNSQNNLNVPNNSSMKIP
jgi:hypothetical protein